MYTLWPDFVTEFGSSVGFSPGEKQAGIEIGSGIFRKNKPFWPKFLIMKKMSELG